MMSEWRLSLALILPVAGFWAPGPLAAQSPPSGLQVTAVRFWSLADVTRVAVEVNGDFRFKSDRIGDPDRIFFDLEGAKPAMARKGMHTTSVEDRLLKRIRVAQTQPGTTRIVLDVEPGVEFAASQLVNPNRLIVELRATAATPARSVETPGVTRSEAVPAEAEKAPSPVAQPVPVPPQPVAEPAPAEKTPEPAAQPESKPAASRARPPSTPLTSVPVPARRDSQGGSTLTRALGLKIQRIVLDPGHGGHDTGTIGASGLAEKDLVLDVAKRLEKLIEDRMGTEVVLTRSDDTFIALTDRTAFANEQKADLFLSIHANSSTDRRASGVETYYLNLTNSREALEVAARENASADKSVHDLQDLLQQISKQEKVEESRELAGKVQQALYGFSTRINPASRNRGVKKAPFVVLIGAQMPSILAEVAFISNPREAAALKRGDPRQRLAEALYRGVLKYVETLSHAQVAQGVAGQR